LTARERVVLVLRYYQDLDDRTIGDVLGIKPSSVRATASRALASLRQTRDSNRVDERLS
jgi:RNA polymerase sigma factor (sigma-70 family)